ncbi:hypothetical protein EVAR_69444_1 [Eumeta japonica]|uniref:RNase H type-1 domain-containing protein n=1 Tax=Eumeta variegata TaxID=151549 RepID=A0A4C1SKP9_EUMVA|nr:hypothetical protein EVAR_69444_1 [Eumeta japonica]
MAAIKTTFQHSANMGKKSLICTDSLSAVKALRENRNDTFQEMLCFGEDFRGKIILLWVPSHMGITGNEHADVGAREALELPEVTEVPCFAKNSRDPSGHGKTTNSYEDLNMMADYQESNALPWLV